MTKELMIKVRDYLIAKCKDKDGDLDMIGMDFSDFDGGIYIGNMKVKKDLYQDCQQVGGNLIQSDQEVGGTLFQYCQKVGGILIQDDRPIESSSAPVDPIEKGKAELPYLYIFVEPCALHSTIIALDACGVANMTVTNEDGKLCIRYLKEES